AATVQSLRSKLADLPPDRFGLVVIDEAHHAPARSWVEVMEHFRPRFLLGCTATPRRLDGRDLGEQFGGPPLYGYGLEQAIEDRHLVPIRQSVIRTGVSLDDVPNRMGDFALKPLGRAVAVGSRNRAIVDGYLRYAPDRPALVFAVDLNHVEQLREAF